MGLDLNKNFGNTVSTKLRHEVVLSDFIINLMDTDQEIKRLLRYMTIAPLSKKSTNMEGKVVMQPDLKQSLRIRSNEGEKIVFYGAYDINIPTIKHPYVFVHTNGSVFDEKKEGWADLFFTIEIVIPDYYDSIYDDEFDINIPRGMSVGIKVSDKLDKYILNDNKYSKLVGNPKFTLIQKLSSRLSSHSDSTLYTYIYKTSVVNMNRKPI